MTANFSKTQIDRLGDRIRKGPITESDLIYLDEYRRSFGETYETVLRTIQQQYQLEPTGRPAKSTSSIIEKLRRESIRLSQIQDIAGCRLVVEGVVKQEQAVASLSAIFPDASVMDRRENPSYGYRAVHVIPRIFGKLIEIQVRTSLQHIWAEFSEKLSDVFDPAIKYGGASEEIRDVLTRASDAVGRIEECEKNLAYDHEKRLNEQDIEELQEGLVQVKKELIEILSSVISKIENKRRPKQ